MSEVRPAALVGPEKDVDGEGSELRDQADDEDDADCEDVGGACTRRAAPTIPNFIAQPASDCTQVAIASHAAVALSGTASSWSARSSAPPIQYTG